MVRDRLVGGQHQTSAERSATSEQLQSVTTSLTRIANSAPSEEGRTAADVVAENLRGLSFAWEGASLLRTGPVPPTADQLAAADLTSRTQLSQLDAAVAGLRAQLMADKEASATG